MRSYRNVIGQDAIPVVVAINTVNSFNAENKNRDL